jgi:hypothetical protein
MVKAGYCSFGFRQGLHCFCCLVCAHEKHRISSSVRDLPCCVCNCGSVAICPSAVADVPPIYSPDTHPFQARPGSSAACRNSECNFALCPGTYGPWIRVRWLSRAGAKVSNSCNRIDDPSRQSTLGILGMVYFRVKGDPNSWRFRLDSTTDFQFRQAINGEALSFGLTRATLCFAFRKFARRQICISFIEN